MIEDILAKFELKGRGNVTVKDLHLLFDLLGEPLPPEQQLISFINDIYNERENVSKKLKVERLQFRTCQVNGATRAATSSSSLQTHFNPNYAPVAHQSTTTTMWEMFQSSCIKFAHNPFLGDLSITPSTTNAHHHHHYTFKSYHEIMRSVLDISFGLLSIGLQPSQYVGMIINSCSEWCILQYALWSQVIYSLYQSFYQY